MSAHKRYFSPISAEAFTGLLSLHTIKSRATADALRMYAVDGADPEAIAQASGLELVNVLRLARRAGEILAAARQACGAVQRPMKITPAELRAFLERHQLEPDAAAKLLGITSASMARHLDESTLLPRSLALSCAAIDAGLEAPKQAPKNNTKARDNAH